MPYAKTDVGFIREHFAAVPEKHRPQAIALYSNLVLISAEMLLDGQLPVTVVLAGAHEIGISRGRYGRSEVSNLGHSLAAAGLVEVSKNDTWQLTYWRDHHASREYVDSRRKADAERKREAREQLTIPSATPVVHKGRPTGVRSGQPSDSCAHARTRAATDSKKEDLTAAASPNHDTEPKPGPAPNPAAAADTHEELEQLLDDLAIPASLRQRAAKEPERALAVARYTIANQGGGAYFRTVFESGDHPIVNGNTPRAKAPELVAESYRKWLDTTAALLEPAHADDLLNDWFERMGIPEADRPSELDQARAYIARRRARAQANQVEAEPKARERWLRLDGWHLAADDVEHLLGEMGAEGDELVELLDLAADLRRGGS